VIHDIKHYIFNPIPLKPILPKSAIALFTIDHQMTMTQFQVWKNFIEDALQDGGFGVNMIIEKLKV